MSAVAQQSVTRAPEQTAIDLEKMPVERVLAQLAVKPEQGLSSAEAQQRLAKYGPNALVEKEVSLLRKILGPFTGPIAYSSSRRSRWPRRRCSPAPWHGVRLHCRSKGPLSPSCQPSSKWQASTFCARTRLGR